MKKKIVVIGGGLGGLSSAIRLAADGNEVIVLEKNERAGGKLNVRSGKGYSFDTGPSILTMPWVLEQLFSSAGRRLEDYMTLTRVEPQWRTFFENGVSLDISGDLPEMLKGLQDISPEDAQEFLSYLQYCQKMYDLNAKSFYSKSLSGLSDLRTHHSMKELMAMDPFRTMHQSTSRFIQNKHLRQLFDFFIMYIGSSPYAAPAVLSQLVYVQMGLGIYYVEGGMYNIAKGMLKLLAEQGVEVRTNAPVASINTKGSVATGVTLEDGTVIDADLIVSNLEAIPAYQTLVKEHSGSADTVKKLTKYAPTVSGLVLLLGVDKQYEQLLHHNFFFSSDPEKEFQQIFEQGIPADDPTIYIGVSSKSDPTQAPEGKENLFVLTHVPPLKPGESWEPLKEKYRDKVLTKLEMMGLSDLRSHIEFEYTFIPDDLQRLYGSNGGSIYGVVTDRKLNSGFKIPSKSDLIDNLYFVGGSTHPGGGVPMVTLSGQLTADLIKEHTARDSKGSNSSSAPAM
ncbi:phytoene desaturase family protein [Paenibacillus pini]|uniref:4,4'-diaponeurosporene oxygenase n=1 Tax=Paenibacillus pini JCM 16418 TaxID=1236976 RepID=W7Y9I0_9BACL|nr:phytoene desaturase family protein [Paenibacillus pini]GAF07650.1 phytoene desaturase, neurosporene or lycopene producing [Paenibacillus pini JCM 16418]